MGRERKNKASGDQSKAPASAVPSGGAINSRDLSNSTASTPPHQLWGQLKKVVVAAETSMPSQGSEEQFSALAAIIAKQSEATRNLLKEYNTLVDTYIQSLLDKRIEVEAGEAQRLKQRATQIAFGDSQLPAVPSTEADETKPSQPIIPLQGTTTSAAPIELQETIIALQTQVENLKAELAQQKLTQSQIDNAEILRINRVLSGFMEKCHAQATTIKQLDQQLQRHGIIWTEPNQSPVMQQAARDLRNGQVVLMKDVIAAQKAEQTSAGNAAGALIASPAGAGIADIIMSAHRFKTTTNHDQSAMAVSEPLPDAPPPHDLMWTASTSVETEPHDAKALSDYAQGESASNSQAVPEATTIHAAGDAFLATQMSALQQWLRENQTQLQPEATADKMSHALMLLQTISTALGQSREDREVSERNLRVTTKNYESCLKEIKAELQTSKAAYQRDQKAAESIIAALRKQLAESNGTIAELKAEQAARSVTAETPETGKLAKNTNKARIAELSKQIEKLSRQSTQLQNTISQEQRRAEALEKANSALKDALVESQARIAAQETQIAELSSQLTLQSNQQSAAQRAPQPAAPSSGAKITQLQATLKAKDRELEASAEREKQLRTQNSQLQAALSAVSAESDSLKQELDQRNSWALLITNLCMDGGEPTLPHRSLLGGWSC